VSYTVVKLKNPGRGIQRLEFKHAITVSFRNSPFICFLVYVMVTSVKYVGYIVPSGRITVNDELEMWEMQLLPIRKLFIIWPEGLRKTAQILSQYRWALDRYSEPGFPTYKRSANHQDWSVMKSYW
jgi:hypothetical protein